MEFGHCINDFNFTILQYVQRIVTMADRFTDSSKHDRFVRGRNTVAVPHSLSAPAPLGQGLFDWIPKHWWGRWALTAWDIHPAERSPFCCLAQTGRPSLQGPPSRCAGLMLLPHPFQSLTMWLAACDEMLRYCWVWIWYSEAFYPIFSSYVSQSLTWDISHQSS